jgi:pimeloyl-ACP methyl ester carboxylesterase
MPVTPGPASSGPPVLLVHGFATSFETTWRHNGWVDLLADAGRPVIGVDLLGHGAAAKPHEPEAYRDMEKLVLDELPPEPVDAVGFSMGARTVLYLVATNPERFRRVVVAGVGANLFDRDANRGAFIRDAILGTSDPDDREAGYFAQLADAPGADRVALAACISRPDGPQITPELLAAVTHPVLVCLGDRDFAGPADPLLDALPNATFKPLRGVDHFATPKDFGFIDAALAFLDAVPG